MTENIENVVDTSTILTASIISKHNIRRKIWEHLEHNNLVNFPRPVYGRIPNFKGCEEAAFKVTELDIFKNAQNVKVNPDKPQEPVRFSVLELHKNLYVPIPRLKSGLLKHIIMPENAIKDDIRKSVSRRGIDECGKDVGLNDDAKIDLVVLGSVAVSKEGYRIGKGKGYADLEYAILSHMKAVNPNTIVVTTVHDCQIIDEAPPEIFGPHDVPVDIIVTPTQVIHVENRLPKPTGVIWNLISQRRVELMPVLKTLREQDEQAGKDVTLKEVDSDVESYANKRRVFGRMRRFRYNRRPRNDSSRQKSENLAEESDKIENGTETEKQAPRRRRYAKKRNIQKDNESLGDSKENSNPNAEDNSPKRRQKRQVRKNRPLIDFSLVIRNIEKTVRVRDLKAALAERGIKPNIITWRGYKGFCCLHFSKTNPNTISDPEQQSHGVDSVLNSLSDLKISPDSKKQLVVEIMKPISRIETTDVTAV